MAEDLIVTREIAQLPKRSDDAHKGQVGRVVVIGGCYGDTVMIGAPALAANAAFRAGAGLVRLVVPHELRVSVGVLAPCATMQSLPTSSRDLLQCVDRFKPDVVAIGPGLGSSLDALVIAEFLAGYGGPIVVDADALNQLATIDSLNLSSPRRIVFTPHPGEAKRLLGVDVQEASSTSVSDARHDLATSLTDRYGCTIVLKGRETIVTNGDRIYTNETGNAGMATGGTGDVLTGLIAGLIGQKMEPIEAAILGTYLHGLAGDFASEELGRLSMTATDVLDYLPEAFGEHEVSQNE